MSQVKKFFSFGRKGTRKDSPSTEKKIPHPIGENEAEAHATTTSSPTRTKEKKRNERRAVSAIQLAAVATTTTTTMTTSNERLTRTLPRTSEKSPTPRTPPPKPKPRRALPIVSATTTKPTKPVDDDDDDYSEPKDATVVKEKTNCGSDDDDDDDDYSKPCGGGGDQRPRPAKRVVNRATYDDPWDRKFRGSAAVVQTIGQSTSNSSTRHKSSARGGDDDGLGDYDDPWDKVPADRVGRVVKATKKLPQSEQPDANDYEFPHDKRLTAEGVVKQKLPSSSLRNDDYDDPWDSKVHAKVGPKKPARARHLPSTGSNDYDDPWDSSGHARLPPPPNRPVPSGPKSNPSSPTSPVSLEDSFAPKPVIDASLPLHSQRWVMRWLLGGDRELDLPRILILFCIAGFMVPYREPSLIDCFVQRRNTVFLSESAKATPKIIRFRFGKNDYSLLWWYCFLNWIGIS